MKERKKFELNNKKNYFEDVEMNHNDSFDLIDKDINIDYEKDEYFDNLQNNKKYSFISKKYNNLKQNKYS